MGFADYVPLIITGVMWMCWIILILYALRVLLFILFGCEEIRRMREAMAVGYSAVAVVFTFQATWAIPNFVQRIVGDGSSIGSPTRGIYALLVICSLIICAAFICNFSRSLWMLKNLDHAVFEPVPDWEDLTKTKLKRIAEFGTRMVAALLFIYLEFKLEKLAQPHGVAEVGLVSEGGSATRPLSQAGFVAIGLYAVLLLWWLSGRWIAGKAMPWLLFAFFVAGLFNSFFIFVFGDAPVDESSKTWLLMTIVVAGALATYMIVYVLLDLIKAVKAWLLTVKGWIFRVIAWRLKRPAAAGS